MHLKRPDESREIGCKPFGLLPMGRVADTLISNDSRSMDCRRECILSVARQHRVLVAPDDQGWYPDLAEFA